MKGFKRMKAAACAAMAAACLGGCDGKEDVATGQGPKEVTQLVLISPKGGQVYEARDTIHVKWKGEGGNVRIPAVDIYLSDDVGKTWVLAKDSAATLDPGDSGSADLPLLDMLLKSKLSFDSTVFGMVRIVRHGGKEAEDSATSPLFALMAETHLVFLTSPAGGETYHVGDTVAVNWVIRHPGDIDALDVELSPDNGANWGFYLNSGSITAYDSDWGHFKWVVTDSVSGGSRTAVLAGNSQVRIRVVRYSSSDSNLFSEIRSPISILPAR
jgi:hypothetical protein